MSGFKKREALFTKSVFLWGKVYRPCQASFPAPPILASSYYSMWLTTSFNKCYCASSVENDRPQVPLSMELTPKGGNNTFQNKSLLIMFG